MKSETDLNIDLPRPCQWGAANRPAPTRLTLRGEPLPELPGQAAPGATRLRLRIRSLVREGAWTPVTDSGAPDGGAGECTFDHTGGLPGFEVLDVDGLSVDLGIRLRARAGEALPGLLADQRPRGTSCSMASQPQGAGSVAAAGVSDDDGVIEQFVFLIHPFCYEVPLSPNEDDGR